MSAWGEDVSCARVQTSPRYGFYVNAVSVLLLLGGGIISLYKAYASDRDLSEAVEMWENDRAETAEMESRLAMIKKKEDYAAAVAAAAASAAQAPVTIFKSRRAAPVVADSNVKAGAGADGANSPPPLSPPPLVSPQATRSFAAADVPKERQDRIDTAAALSPIDLEGNNGKIEGAGSAASVPSQPSILESPCWQSPEPKQMGNDWDVESGVGAAGADAGTAMPGNTGKGGVDDDLPPPQGWEVRTTPSGEK